VTSSKTTELPPYLVVGHVQNLCCFTHRVYYESIKRELNRRLLYECRCDERLKPKAERSTRLAYTGFRGGLEHLKIETRLIDERLASVMGECEIVTLKVCHLFLELYVKLPSWKDAAAF
jgi:hypothetical protein